MIEWVILGLALLVIAWLALTYNSFVRLRMRVKNALSQIDVQLKRRNDLVPNLVSTVKGYAKHEKKVFIEVTKARTAMMSAKGMAAKAKASNMLSNTLKSLFAVAENYPQLKASENFLKLQEELSSLEEKIAYSRSFYNDVVQKYNTKLEVVPDSLVGNAFGFKQRDFFAATAAERKNVKVEF
jgi:LemA protein